MADIVRAGALWGYRQLVLSLGGDPEALLGEVGLSSRDIDDHDNYIPRRAAQALLERTAETLQRHDFGLRLAATQDIYVLGALAFAIRNAADLRGALRTASKYAHYQAPMSSLTVELYEDGDQERIVFQGGIEPPSTARQAHEQVIGLLCRMIIGLTSDVARPVAVHFRHDAVSPATTYRKHFAVVPRFDMDADGVVVRTADMAAPLRTADPQLQAIVERYLDFHSPRWAQHADQQVRHVLSRLMRIGNATVTDVADVLRMHPRTLQRKLGAAGTTFEQLRDEVRRDLAEVYLAQEMVPIAHVAQLLGYADQSVLTRSCIRWFGKTPVEIRREYAARLTLDA